MKWMMVCIETMILILIITLTTILLTYPEKIDLYGEEYLSIEDTIDLSKTQINNYDDLQNKIGNFTNLKTIDLGNNPILYEDYSKIVTAYPDININAIKVYKIYGLTLNDQIEDLDLSNVIIDEELVNYLAFFPKLKKVNLLNQSLSIEEKENLMKKYPNIEFVFEVSIGTKKFSSDVSSIDLNDVYIEDIQLFYRLLKLMPNLSYAFMGTSNLDNEVLSKLNEDFPKIDIEWTINFGVWHINTNDTAFSVLISDFPYVPLKSEDLEFLKYCKKLKALDLGHQNITDLSVITDNLPELRFLILADNKITDLTPLKNLKQLRYLELFINYISDLSPLEDCQELVDLNLCYNRITDVTTLTKLPKLERLWLIGNRLTPNDLNTLYDTYPNGQVIYYGKGSTENGWRTHERYFKMIKMFRSRTYDDTIFEDN